MTQQWPPQDFGRQPYPPQGQPQWQQPGYGQAPGSGQPPWQPQPPAPQPPQRGRKSWFARHKILTGLGVLVIIGGIGSAVGGSKNSPAPAPTQAVQPSAAAPVATQAAATTPSAAPAFKPHTVATFTGSGTQNTARFTVTNTWKLAYSFDCSSFGSSGNFQVYEDGGSGGSGASVNDLAASKTSSTWAYNDGGTHYLEVNSECSWTVKVIDEG